MTRTNYAGIDYGLGKSNIDVETGIRYGVISQHSLADWFYEEQEPVYIARCPECYSENIEETPEHDELDNHCKDCGIGFHDGEQYADEPDYWTIDASSEGIECEITDLGLMVLKSPVCITAQFCSPCVPGAGNLDSPCETGALTYALPLDWLRQDSPAYSEWDLIDSTTRKAI